MKAFVLFAIFIFSVGISGSLRAQTPHDKKGYVTIANGTAPNHRYALVAHGDGANGADNFQIYLVSEPGHKKVVQVTDLSNVAVVAPKSYQAFWSPDSRHVAVSYIDRTSQHANTLELFRIEGGKAILIEFRSALSALTEKRGVTALWEKEARNYHEAGSSEIKWLTNSRFVLTDGEWLTSPTPRLAKAMGKYAKARANEIPASAEPGEKTYETVLSVSAVCEFRRYDRVRIVSIKPGPHSFRQ